jgi:hypothetical protein
VKDASKLKPGKKISAKVARGSFMAEVKNVQDT